MAAAAPARVAGIEAALPSHRLDQDAARAAAARLFGGLNVLLLARRIRVEDAARAGLPDVSGVR